MIPTEAELLGQVATPADSDARAIAFAASPGWKGSDTLVAGGHTFRVVEARSVLEFRQHLEEAEARDERLVFRTQVPSRELGLEVLARLAKREVQAVDAWVAVKSAFRAREVDPWLRRHRHLATRLLDYAPPSGYPPAPGGVLTEDVAWSHLLRQAFAIPREDVRDLLVWTVGQAPARYLAAPEDLRQTAAQRLARSCGPVATLVLGCVEHGHAADVLPLGLACGALVEGDGELAPAQHAAAARLERYTGSVLTPAAGRTWARLAREVFEELTRADTGEVAARLLRRSDELLQAVGGLDFADRSDLSPEGFRARLRTFAQALEAAMDDPAALPAAADALARLLAHREAKEPRREALEMALRLARWLAQPPKPAADLAGMARHYRDEGSFVDQARRRLSAAGAAPELDRILARLSERVQARREEENRRFGTALTAAASGLPANLMGVETVLDRVVAPLAASKRPVLLLVLDGAAWAVARELLPDLARLGWTERQPDGGSLPPVLTVFPSVTEASRTALLTGSLATGDQALERKRFREHAALVAACRADSPPQLLHKADLAGPAAGQLPPELGDRLESDRHRVLGVVVNAVDDHLGATDQLDFPWTVATITPLGQLLGHALRGQRTVVLVADHGHVLERGTDLRPGGEGAGDRWRTGTPGEGEVALEGQRVLLGGGAVVVPWTERLRYTPKRAGYHGGATPQEVVTPLLVLAPAGRAVAGWREVPSERPSWWSEPRAQEPAAVGPLSAPSPFADGQFALFEEPRATSVVQAALNSAPVRARRAAMGADAPDPDLVLRLLQVLEEAAGPLPREELARRLQLPEATLRQVWGRASHLLALDGRQVLSSTFDGEMVLHRDALERLATAVETSPPPRKGKKSTELEVQTPSGALVRVTVPLSGLSQPERQVLEALARHGRMSEAELGRALGTRRIGGLMEILLEKLAGWPGLVPEGEGPEGRIYAFHREAR